MRATGFRLLGRGHAAEHCGREGMLPVAMRFELRLHKHQHKHTNWPRPRRRAPHHARGIAQLPCDECLGPRDRRFSHTDRAARGCEAAVGTQPVPACSRIATSGRRSTAQSRGGSRVRRRLYLVTVAHRGTARPSHPPSAADGSAQGTSPPGRPGNVTGRARRRGAELRI